MHLVVVDQPLKLGDLRLMAKNLTWTRDLLQNYGVPAEALGIYLDAFKKTIQQVIGSDAKVVVDFLETLEI